MAVLTVAITVGLLNFPIYRFLEGYTMPRWLARRMRRRQLRRRRRLSVLAHRGIELAAEELDLYPEHSADVLPTRLGNGHRAFERYGVNRFGLDSQALWYELLAVAPPVARTEIDETRSPVDFFVSGVVHLTMLSTASFVTWCAAGGSAAFIVAVLSATLVPAAYYGAVRNLGDYASAVRALVNLGRPALAQALGLQLPPTACLEREMWEAATALVQWHENGALLFGRLDQFRIQTPIVQNGAGAVDRASQPAS